MSLIFNPFRVDIMNYYDPEFHSGLLTLKPVRLELRQRNEGEIP